MLTVACVYWKGSFRGREKIYTTDWIVKLRNMVARNLTVPHRFVCLSNVELPEDIERIELINDWPGWWSKIELFRSYIFEDKVLYLDLDTVILRQIDAIANFPHPFGILETGNGTIKTSEEGKTVIRRYNSSVMLFDREAEVLYDTFVEDPDKWMAKFRGDQDFIGHVLPDLHGLPSDWVVKLRDHRRVPIPTSVKILLCMDGSNGKNDRALQRYPELKKLWK